jgi:hypothetical protein
MFVSMYDGRKPLSNDYDYSSTMYGTDRVALTSNDTIISTKGIKTSSGLLFIIGFKALSDNANYTLMIIGPYHYNVS